MKSPYSGREALALAFTAGLAFAGLMSPASATGSAFCTVTTNWVAQLPFTETGTRATCASNTSNRTSRGRHPRSRSARCRGTMTRSHDQPQRRPDDRPQFRCELGLQRDCALPTAARHIHNHRGAKLPERWDFTEPGDIRRSTLARSRHHPANVYGVMTGQAADRRFSGPQSRRRLAERTLQPGTAPLTYCLAPWNDTLPIPDSGWFAQVSRAARLPAGRLYRLSAPA